MWYHDLIVEVLHPFLHESVWDEVGLMISSQNVSNIHIAYNFENNVIFSHMPHQSHQSHLNHINHIDHFNHPPIIPHHSRLVEDMIDTCGIETRGSSNDAMNRVALFQQKLRQIRPILPGLKQKNGSFGFVGGVHLQGDCSRGAQRLERFLLF